MLASIRWLQPLIGQIEPVHDLVVVVPRRPLLIAAERVRVRALEVDDPAAFLVEIRMLLGIVEAVLVVRDDLHAFVHGPSGDSASAYHTSPSSEVPNCCTAIMTNFFRYSFQFTDPAWAMTGLPVARREAAAVLRRLELAALAQALPAPAHRPAACRASTHNAAGQRRRGRSRAGPASSRPSGTCTPRTSSSRESSPPSPAREPADNGVAK